ncbi:MAG: chaperone NapD [Bacteroidetes bacterium]|nr:chaperone NapD [Bacteroidota bacterium]
MPIKSYLVHAAPGHKEIVRNSLLKQMGCDVFPAENEDVLVLVTDTQSKQDELVLESKLAEIPNIQNMVLVAGFVDEKSKK